MQKFLNVATHRNIILTPDRQLNILIYWTLYVIIYRAHKLPKIVCFGPSCTYHRDQTIAAWYARRDSRNRAAGIAYSFTGGYASRQAIARLYMIYTQTAEARGQTWGSMIPTF